jgi:hypothetical protein
VPALPSFHQWLNRSSYKYQGDSQKNGIVRQLLNQTIHTTIPANMEYGVFDLLE